MANRFREKPQEEPTKAVADEALHTSEVAAEAEAPQADEKGEEKKTRKGGFWAQLLGADVLESKMVRRQIPLVLLCMVYLLLIVSNRYRVERLSRDRKATAERVEQLREHRIMLQEQYQQSVRISQIADDLKQTGVGITAGPPYEIEK